MTIDRSIRAERHYRKGPDVLWLLNEESGFVIEAKSRKSTKNALTKEEHGQLLTAAEWFKDEYPDMEYERVSVHPNANITSAQVAGTSKALTPENLAAMVDEARSLFESLCNSDIGDSEIADRADQLLCGTSLTPEKFASRFLVPFVEVE